VTVKAWAVTQLEPGETGSGFSPWGNGLDELQFPLFLTRKDAQSFVCRHKNLIGKFHIVPARIMIGEEKNRED